MKKRKADTNTEPCYVYTHDFSLSIKIHPKKQFYETCTKYIFTYDFNVFKSSLNTPDFSKFVNFKKRSPTRKIPSVELLYLIFNANFLKY